MPKIDEGSEHLVFFEESHAEVWKLTRPGIFGDSYYLVGGLVHQRNCSPLEYLIRLRLWKRVFQFAPKALGLTRAGQIVSIQRFIAGEPPTQDAVDSFLTEAGLMPVKRSCWLWKKSYRHLEVWVGDARADNFVLSPSGIVPIDLRLWLGDPDVHT